MYRAPDSTELKRVSWDWALDHIATLMKQDRERWITAGFLGASAATNKTALLTYKVVRSTGALIFDNQARV